MVAITRKFVGRDGWKRPLGFDNGGLKVGTLDANFVTLVGASIEDIEKETRH